MNLINNLCHGFKSTEQSLNQYGINPRISGIVLLMGTAVGYGTPVACGMAASFAVDKLFQALFPSTNENSPSYNDDHWDTFITNFAKSLPVRELVLAVPISYSFVTDGGEEKLGIVRPILLSFLGIADTYIFYKLVIALSSSYLVLKDLAVAGASVAGTIIAKGEIGNETQIKVEFTLLMIHIVGTALTQTTNSLLHELNWNTATDHRIDIYIKKCVTHLVLFCGANIDHPRHKDSTRYSPLLNSIAEGNLDRVQFYLDHGANVHITTREGQNALCIFNSDHIDQAEQIINLLINHGITVNVSCRHTNPLNHLWQNHIAYNKNPSQVAHIQRTFLSLVQRGALFYEYTLLDEKHLKQCLEWYIAARASIPPRIRRREAEPLMKELGNLCDEINLLVILQQFYDPTQPFKRDFFRKYSRS